MKQFSNASVKVKDNSGNWNVVPALAGDSAYDIAVRRGTFSGTEAEWLNAIETERDAAVASIQSKGTTTLASIPNDYTTLSNTVDDVIHSGFNQHIRIPFEFGTLASGVGYLGGYRASQELTQDGKVKIIRSTSEASATSFGVTFTVENDPNVDLTGHKILFRISDVDISELQGFSDLYGWARMGTTAVGNISWSITDVQAGEMYYLYCSPTANIENYVLVARTSNAVAAGTYFTIGSLQWFDLTEMFGAGNEPDMKTFLSVYEADMPYGLIMPSATDHNKATKALISDAVYPTKALADNILLQTNGTEYGRYIGLTAGQMTSSSLSKVKVYPVTPGKKYYVYTNGNKLLVAGYNSSEAGYAGEFYIKDNDNANVMHSFVPTKPIVGVYYSYMCANVDCFLYVDNSIEKDVFGADPEERALYREDIMACAASYLVHQKNTTCVIGTPTGLDTPFVTAYSDSQGYDSIWGNSNTYNYYSTREYDGITYPLLYLNSANFATLLMKCIPYADSPMYYAFNHVDAPDFNTMSGLALGNGTYATKPYTIDMHYTSGYKPNEIAYFANHSGNRLYKYYDGTSFDNRVYDMLETGDIIYFSDSGATYANYYKTIRNMGIFVKSLDDINKYGALYGVTFRSSQHYAADNDGAHGYLIHAASTVDGEDCVRIVSVESYIAEINTINGAYVHKANATPFNSTKAACVSFNVIDHALYL